MCVYVTSVARQSVVICCLGDQSDDKEATNSPVSPHAACPSSTSPSKSPQKKKLPVVESPEKVSVVWLVIGSSVGNELPLNRSRKRRCPGEQHCRGN